MDFVYRKSIELELYEKVGDRIKEIMRNKKLSVKGIAQKLKDENVFQSYNTARKFIIDVRNGYINLLVGRGIKRNELKTKANLEKISYLFSAIGINDDEVIGIVRNSNPDFRCPLKKEDYLNI